VDKLADFYLNDNSKDHQKIFDLIAEAKKMSKANLMELNSINANVRKNLYTSRFLTLGFYQPFLVPLHSR